MLKFNEWIKIKENLWGNTPVKGKKPSDGYGTGMQSAAAPMQQKMKKKMEKK